MRHTQMISFFTIATAVLLLLSCEPRNTDSETSASQNEELAEDPVARRGGARPGHR